jgi:acyl-CoA hydrolase
LVAEVNARVPFVPGALLPQDVRIDHFVHADEPLVEFPAARIDDVSRQVATYLAPLVPDRATLQMGIGSLMEAICHALRSHRGLGVHTGILTDGLAELMRSGAVNNEHKGSFPGQSVAASLLGTRALFEFAHGNAAVRIVETDISHGAASLARLQRFCSINSAVEVDLTGQVNAEVSRGRYVGAVGGQPDYIRAAAACEDGMSIIALPSAAGSARTSRIVTQLAGPVTTLRSDVHWVVTEWGAANLRNTSLRGRAKALAAIAHPDHRDALLREADHLPAW